VTTTQIIAAIAIVIVALIALAARRSGPRVTTIETRHDKRDGAIETRRVDRDEAEK